MNDAVAEQVRMNRALRVLSRSNALPNDEVMTEKTPVLIADVRSLDGRRTSGRIAPAAWIVSLAIHAAAILGFLDRTSVASPRPRPKSSWSL